MTQETVEQYRDENTREIHMPDGSTREIRMTPGLWEELEFLRLVEDIQEPEIAGYALEEVSLQNVEFDRAFRGVVAHFANRWK